MRRVAEQAFRSPHGRRKMRPQNLARVAEISGEIQKNFARIFVFVA
jgi:hypothetical protein